MSLIIVLGPTASGKTSLSVDLAEKFHGEIVGADSVQIYRDLVIGAASPTEEEKRGIPHHLIGEYSLDMETNAGKFAKEALPVVEDILSRNKSCVMAGGTNFYVEAFLNGLSPVPQIGNTLRQEINEELDRHETGELYERLLKIDPQWAENISSPNDRQRIKRGLEVYAATGKNLSQWNKMEREKSFNGSFLAVAIEIERDCLYKKINERSKLMIKKGLVAEVEEINRKGFSSSNCKAMNSIGYRETEMFLSGLIKSVEDLENTIALNTRHLAKRQLTWLRSRPYVMWERKNNIPEIAKEYLLKVADSWF
jgi:tRNA dimethylallyltransferase